MLSEKERRKHYGKADSYYLDANNVWLNTNSHVPRAHGYFSACTLPILYLHNLVILFRIRS